MSFWTAIVVIVLIGSVTRVVRDGIRRGQNPLGNRDDLKGELAKQKALVDELRIEVDSLKAKVAEQEVFVDEAIAQFRPRIDRLREDRDSVRSKVTAENTADTRSE